MTQHPMSRRTSPSQTVGDPFSDDGSNRLLVHAGKTIWTNALLLFVLSALCLAVFTPFVLAASAAGWLAVWGPMVLCTAPFWALVVATGNRLLDGYGVAMSELPALWRRTAGIACRVALAPAVIGTAVLALLSLASGHPSSFVLRIFVFLALGVLFSIVLLIGPAMCAATRFEVGAASAWTLGARQLIAAPVQQLGLVGCFAIVCWLAIAVGPVLLLALGPLGVLTAALGRGHANAIAIGHEPSSDHPGFGVQSR